MNPQTKTLKLHKPWKKTHVFFLIISSFVAQIHGSKGGDWYEPRRWSHYKCKSVWARDSKENDRIESLPGQPRVAFEQYGGYITVDKS